MDQIFPPKSTDATICIYPCILAASTGLLQCEYVTHRRRSAIRGEPRSGKNHSVSCLFVFKEGFSLSYAIETGRKLISNLLSICFVLSPLWDTTEENAQWGGRQGGLGSSIPHSGSPLSMGRQLLKFRHLDGRAPMTRREDRESYLSPVTPSSNVLGLEPKYQKYFNQQQQ